MQLDGDRCRPRAHLRYHRPDLGFAGVGTTMVSEHAETSWDCASCVLLFSGGRDSTVAAARLAARCESLVLLTISDLHLLGIERVRSRVAELKPHFKNDGKWMHVAVSRSALGMGEHDYPGCLTCQHAHIAVAARIAEQLSMKHVGLGYTEYQAGWVEQSPYAVARLSAVLADVGKTLVLPARDLHSKDEAKHELRVLHLSERALEQKCSRQQTNATNLAEEAIRAEIDRWAETLRRLLVQREGIEFQLLESTIVEAMR